MARIYGRELIDTLHERMGGDAQLLGPANEGVAPDGAWGRAIGYWGHRDGESADPPSHSISPDAAER